MANYKVIQDIEAEDKLLGPLTLRQFIYACIVIVSGIIAWQAAKLTPLLVVPFLPVMLFFGLLAAPFGKDQSSEVWLLAKVRFFIKPRKRIWDQSGMSQLVTITAPKQIERQLTDGLSQHEVKSRLHSLADVIDSRGWATKNATLNAFINPSFGASGNSAIANSDRLISAGNLPMDVPAFGVDFSDDMFDEKNNPRAQQLSEMIVRAEATHRQKAMNIAKGSTAGAPPQGSQVAQPSNPQNDYWFLNQDPAAPHGSAPTYVVEPSSTPVTVQATPSDRLWPSTQEINETDAERIIGHANNNESVSAWKSHMKTILPLEEQQKRDAEEARQRAESQQREAEQAAMLNQRAARVNNEAAAPMTHQANPAILGLANNDDLDVATIERQANRKPERDDDEVVINLHSS